MEREQRAANHLFRLYYLARSPFLFYACMTFFAFVITICAARDPRDSDDKTAPFRNL